ncbi:tubulin epsilon and delta complex protein 1 isoform X3 [Meles meles]|uniref:tubulin epsilon and delta complex protein 1 isoform X3 n=1 Tax=Meles meles TaxID=9662 RepID=UPI001E698DBD|nr:tubulin epsilon and delta complex protein 1 isoform X3 [Meles meles]
MGRRRRRGGRGHAVGALPEAIAALSQTLPAGPSPEIFRRAKFDRPEAAPALWQLLSRVLAPPPAAAGRASPALGAQVRLVKSALCSQGYPRRVLAQLPEDGSQGSRELLLALAWLLARGPLLEHVLAQTRVWLGDEIPLCQCEALAGPGPPAPCQAADGPVDVRHLQWLMGKLRFRWRDLITSQQEQCALLGKIHSYTRGCHSDRSLGHLSVAETELLRDPEGGRQLLQRLESENARLEAALAWRRRELVFWQWMDTVLGSCPLEASPATFLPRDPALAPGELELVARELRGLHEELRAAAEPRRAAWEAQFPLQPSTGNDGRYTSRRQQVLGAELSGRPRKPREGQGVDHGPRATELERFSAWLTPKRAPRCCNLAPPCS